MDSSLQFALFIAVLGLYVHKKRLYYCCKSENLFYHKNKEDSKELVLPVLFFAGLPQSILFTIVLAIFFYEYWDKWKSREIKIFETCRNSIVLFLLLWPILFLIVIINDLILGNFSEQKIVNDLKTQSNIIKVNIIINALIFAPIVEEIIFRKILFRMLFKRFNLLLSAIVTSILFACVHHNVLSFSVLFTFGTILCFIYYYTGKICYPIILHLIFNLLMITFILING